MFKRLLVSFFFVLVCSVATLATDIQISGFQINNFQRPGTTAQVRIWYSSSNGQNIVDSNGVPIVVGAAGTGPVYKIVIGTLNPTTHVLTIPSFTIPSTNDSSQPNSKVTARIYDSAGTPITYLWTNWIIPYQLGTPITFAQLNTYQPQAGQQPPTPGYPTTDQVLSLINAVQPCAKSSDVAIGCLKLSVLPASSVNPIAVGDNDPRVTADQAATVASIRTLGVDTLQAMPGQVIPLPAPGLVTLTNSGVGSLSAGVYKIGVVAVNALGGEGQFDPIGFAANNSITIGASRKIDVTWAAVPGAASYHVYVWGPSSPVNYYQRYYETSNLALTLSAAPAGPVLSLTSTSTVGITAWTATYPLQITTASPHGLVTGQSIIISGGTGNAQKINSSWIATVTGASTFTILIDGSSFASSPPTGTPVVAPISLISSNTGGSLPRGNYYFNIEAEFTDGGTISQTNLGNFPVGTVTTNTGSIALSWTAVTGATQYRVHVISDTDGNPRTHTKYFVTPSNSVTVTGSESYARGVRASQMHGDGEVESSGVGIFGTIRTTSDAKSFFGADIQIASKKLGDAGFQANRYDSNGFAGLSLRQGGTEFWRIGLEGSEDNFYIFRPATPFYMFKIDYDTGLTTIGESLQVQGAVQIESPNPLQWLSNDTSTVRIYTFSTTYGIGTDTTDMSLFVPSGAGISFRADGVTGTSLMRIQGDGKVGIGTTSPTGLLDINSDKFRVRTAKTPASASATCNQGEIAWDASFLYACVATNTWKRSAISTW